MVFNFGEKDMESVRKGVATILYRSTTAAAAGVQVTELTEILVSELKIKLDYKKETFIVQNKNNAGCDMQTYIALLAFEFFEHYLRNYKKYVVRHTASINKIL